MVPKLRWRVVKRRKNDGIAKIVVSTKYQWKLRWHVIMCRKNIGIAKISVSTKYLWCAANFLALLNLLKGEV
jgi:hypothetical protein